MFTNIPSRHAMLSDPGGVTLVLSQFHWVMLLPFSQKRQPPQYVRFRGSITSAYAYGLSLLTVYASSILLPQ